MTYSAPLKATLQLVINEDAHRQHQAAAQHHREGGLSRRAAPAHTARHVRHQWRRARDRQPAAPVARRGVRGVDAPERPAPHLVAHHPVPRLVGRVHGRHPRRDLRPHRQEEEVPGHRAAPRVRLRQRTRTSSASSSPCAISTSRKKRESRTDVREVHRRHHRRGHRAPRRSDGRGRAQGARPRRPRAERERAENVLLVREGDELTEEVLQPSPPPEHRDGQGLRVVHDDRPARRAGRDRARRAPRAPRARRRRRRPETAR